VRNRFIARIYGEHPYRHPREGTRESISRLHRSHLLGFYERFYMPGQTILALVGDLEGDAALRLVKEKFGGWEGEAPGRTGPPAPPVPRGLQVERIQKDGMTQATLRLGGLGLRRNSPDHIPVVLMNYILGGGGFGSRLMQRLREEKGLTYGVSSDFHLREQTGYFYIECQTVLERMNEAVREILAEVERMRQDGVSDAELESARRFFTGSLPLSFQTGDQISTRLLEKEFFGLEEEFWHKELERMRATTREEVREVARRYLDPEKYTLVALADFRNGELEMKER
jgi:zinc protease